MLSAATGARFGTVAWKACWADSPPGSLAVTVMVAVPPETPVIVRLAPDTATVATSGSDDSAAYVSASPSGSLKCPARSSVTEAPARTDWPGMLSAATGARFGTVASKACCAESPPGSLAVTVTAAVPPETPVTVRLAPDTATVATSGSEEAAA